MGVARGGGSPLGGRPRSRGYPALVSTSPSPGPGVPEPRPTSAAAGPGDRGGTARRVAGAVTTLEGLVLVGFFAFWIYEIVVGATEDVARGATSAVLILVFALLLLVVARGWFVGADWARTPTLVWNVLLLPVAWSLHTSERDLVALGVLAAALVSVGAALAVPPRAGHEAGGGGEPEEPVS